MATKSDVIAKVARKYSCLHKAVVETIINMFFQILSDALKYHDKVEIRGFGSFSIRSYNLAKENHLMLQKFAKDKYFKVYFRSSEKLSKLING